MAATGIAVGGLLVLVMIAVSVRGWRTLPPYARVPISHGFRGYGNYLSKTAGLIAWPAGGIFVYGLYSAVFAESLVVNSGNTGTPLLGLPAVLAVLVSVQRGAIRSARRTSGLG